MASPPQPKRRPGRRSDRTVPSTIGPGPPLCSELIRRFEYQSTGSRGFPCGFCSVPRSAPGTVPPAGFGPSVLPLLQYDRHPTQRTVTWVFTAFLLSASVFTPLLGRVGDMIGKEKALLGVLILLALGLVLAAVSQSIGLMIVARAVQGIGGSV